MLVVVPLGGADLLAPTWKFYAPAIGRSLTLNPPDNPGAFAGTHYDILDGAMGTIRYEFRCTLLVILLGMAGLLKRPLVLGLAAVMLVSLSPFATGNAEALPAWMHAPLWLGIPTEAMKLTGMFLARATYRAVQDAVPLTRGWGLLAAAALIICLFVPFLARVGVASAGAYLTFGIAALGRGTVLERINNENDVSYGVYLYA